jgi:anti-anti-sigma regulatory factor
MYLTNMTNEVKDTLELVGITTIISVSSTEEEALNEM